MKIEETKSSVLKVTNIKEAVEYLASASYKGLNVWIENEQYYKSKACEMMWGKIYTDEEIERAKKAPNHFLEFRRGVRLYCSFPIPVVNL